MAKKYNNDYNLNFLNDREKETDMENDDQHFEIPPPRRLKKGLILAFALVAFFVSSVIYINASMSPLAENLKIFPWVKSFTSLFGGSEQKLQGQKEDRINVLIIGMGGQGHEGAYLADTIILASFKPSTKQVALISFPRDMAANIPGYGWRKINNANAFGERDGYPGGGARMLADTLEKITKQKIPYYVRVDFNGFEKIIDDLGGIDVYVERSFTDTRFPAEDFTTHVVSFTQGQRHMNGKTALTYARSRHGNNSEGSDFARAKRQQKILLAVKDKITSPATLINPSKLIGLYNNLSQYVETNFDPQELLSLARMGKNLRYTDITQIVIDNGPQGLLKQEIGEEGAYLLVPRTGLGNYGEIRELVGTIFTKPEKLSEPPKTVILNGTTMPGYAAALAQKLSANDFSVVATANHLSSTVEQTLVYRLRPDHEPSSVDIIKKLLAFKELSALPSQLTSYLLAIDGGLALDQLDYIIVLGKDNQNILK